MRNLNYADSSFTLVHRRPAKQTVRNKIGPDLSHRNPPARNLNSESIGKLGALLIVKKN